MDERRIEGSVTTMERPYRAPFPWEVRETRGGSDAPTAHVRAVEFIAKPGKNSDLRRAIASSVVPFLEQQPGFKNSFILTPHGEPRLVLVVSFWESELDSRETTWESAPEIQRIVLSLLDSFSRVRTYQAIFPEVFETKPQQDLQLC